MYVCPAKNIILFYSVVQLHSVKRVKQHFPPIPPLFRLRNSERFTKQNVNIFLFYRSAGTPQSSCFQEHYDNGRKRNDPLLTVSQNSSFQCCGSGPFFRIRIRGSGFRNLDPKKARSGCGSYLNMFLVFSKINILLYGIFIPNLNIL